MGMVVKSNKAGTSVTSLVTFSCKLPQYEEWKQVVFIRDRFQGQYCGARSDRKQVIEADHLISLAKLIRESKVKSVEEAQLCLILWDTNSETIRVAYRG